MAATITETSKKAARLTGRRLDGATVLLLTESVVLLLRGLPLLLQWMTPVPSFFLLPAGLLADMLLLWPLLVSVTGWFYSAFTGWTPPLSALFSPFSSFKRWFAAVRLRLYSRLYLLLSAFLAFFPGGFLLLYTTYPSRFRPEGLPPLLLHIGQFFAILMLLCGGLWLLRAVCGVFLCDYLYYAEGLPPLRCLRESLRRMKGRRLKLIALDFSFSGWFLLCLLIVPAFFVLPYFLSSRAALAQMSMRVPVRASSEKRMASAKHRRGKRHHQSTAST